LARLFADYEPGIHYPQLQMQAGTMGIHTIRVYNPIKQLHDKDIDGQFVQKYLPELALLPKYAQAEPWNMTPIDALLYNFVLGRDYPHPILDIHTANHQARQILYTKKKSVSPQEKINILQKHVNHSF
jgi:deoxyribodipyrimidine photo-lyase